MLGHVRICSVQAEVDREQSALVRTHVFAPVCPLSELLGFEFCVARSDDSTEWTELKLQSQRG